MKRKGVFKVFFLLAAVGGLLSGSWVSQAGAQDYPSRPITVIVPFTAGGSTDMAVRTLAPYAGKYLKTSLAIENVPGADGAIGYNKGYSSKPDGYSLLASNTLPLFLTEHSRETKYKSLEFKPIFAFARDSMILLVHPEFAKTFEEFVKMARSQTVRIGTTGGATTTGLMGILLAEELGLKVTWIPFGGGAESLTSLAGKHIDAVLSIAASAVALSKAGKVRPLAVFSEKRNEKYPEVPVPKELGLEIPLLFNHTGFAGPPGLGEDKIRILEQGFQKTLEDHEYLEKIKGVATYDLVPLSSKEYRQEFERLSTLTEKYKRYLK